MSERVSRKTMMLLTIALLGFGSAAQADVILEIDVSDPTAVAFLPTAAFSEITVNETAFNGITLLDFFTGNTVVLDSQVDSGGIEVSTASGGTASLPYIFAGLFVGGWTLDDLNFYDPFNPLVMMSFADDATALFGSAIHDLSGMGALPTAGMIGSLITGEPDAATPLVLGQWKVRGAVAVSEPSTLALALGGIALLGLRVLRRRREPH